MLESEMFEDLAYDEAEGAADLYDQEDDDFEDEYDEFDEADEMDLGDELEAFDEGDEYDDFEDEADEYDEYDDFEDEGDEFDDFEDEDAMDNAMAYALDAEDADEFFGKLFRGIKKIARKVAPVIGRVARIAAPILSKIPHPWAQLGGQAARLLSRLRAEGASEEEAMEAMAELAVRNRRAIPIVAGLAARSLVKSKGKRMSFRARKKVVKDVKKAARILVKKRGPKAIRALPKIVKRVKRTAVARRQPVILRPTIVKRTAIKVARSPRLTRKLAKPTVRAIRLVRLIKRVPVVASGLGGLSSTRTYTTPGPAKITIRAL